MRGLELQRDRLEGQFQRCSEAPPTLAVEAERSEPRSRQRLRRLTRARRAEGSLGRRLPTCPLWYRGRDLIEPRRSLPSGAERRGGPQRWSRRWRWAGSPVCRKGAELLAAVLPRCRPRGADALAAASSATRPGTRPTHRPLQVLPVVMEFISRPVMSRRPTAVSSSTDLSLAPT